MHLGKTHRRHCLALSALLALTGSPASASVITFEASDFGLTQTFNNATTFSFTIDIAANLVAGGSYINPTLNSVNYNVSGVLTSLTPSGFPGFNLVRSISGADFYSQGSSLNFMISSTADLSDGLQFDELSGTGTVFTLNAREVGTGRYHPALVELNSNGTGTLQNSNNLGGINPGNGMPVDVDFGEEYITGLSFNPSTFVLADAASVPESSVLAVFGVALACTTLRRRRP